MGFYSFFGYAFRKGRGGRERKGREGKARGGKDRTILFFWITKSERELKGNGGNPA